MHIKAIGLTILFLLSFFAIPAPAHSQEVAATLPMTAQQYRLGRLASGVTSDQAIFPLDSSTNVRVEIIASAGGLTTSIVTPGGQVIDANNVASLGGTYNAIEGSTQDAGLLVLPLVTPGFHHLYTFPSQGAGNYTVRVQSSTNPSEDIAILMQVNTDSAIRTALFATEGTVVQGNPAVFSAAVFNGPTALSGATVTVNARRESDTPITFTLLDDGGVADDAAGDGLYSGEFIPNTPGDYQVLAVITGTTAGGITYTRHSMAQIKVVSPTSRLTGTVQDQGVDDNADGLFDRIRLNVQTNTTLAGNYSIVAHLSTASGQSVTSGAKVTLATGTALSSIDFQAAAFIELGENGPYNIDLIELFYLGPTETFLADRLENVGQTQAYTLTQLNRPPLVVTGPHTVTGIDTNGNGKYDILRIQSQVLATVPGFYEWSAVLADAAGSEINFVSSFGFFVAGSNIMTIDFSGSAIGQHAVNGPYTVKSVIVFGQDQSTIVDRLLTTQPFSYKEFENSDNLRLGTVTMQEASGDGDTFVEPGENGSLSVQLTNVGGTTINGINATLSTSTPGVTITSAQSTYPSLAASGSALNATPFTFTLSSAVPCAETIEFKLTISHVGDGGIPSVFHLTVQSGRPTSTSTFSYTGAAVAIPDNQAAGVNIPISVSGLSGSIKDLNFRFDGSVCSSTEGATTVGLDHPFVGDLVATLTSPSGTKVRLLNRPGSPSAGNNFCNTILDDEGGTTSIQSISSLGHPFSGTFLPAEALAAFRGENPNGTWTLNVADNRATDVGNVRAFSLVISQAECASQPSKILFRRNDGINGNLKYELYVMNEDGSSQTKITTTTNSSSGHYQPRWSPNGQKVGFAAEQDGTSCCWDIMVMNPDGTNRLNLTQNPAFESIYAWSPDSNKLVYETDWEGTTYGEYALWLRNADGTGATRLVETQVGDQIPSWSHNSKIAFTRMLDVVAGKPDIFVINPDGTNLTNLTQSDAVEYAPVWSPNGTKIMYARRATMTFSPWNIYVMNADGSNVQQLTTTGVLTDYQWSPDGTKIAFSSNSSGNYEIYVMNADGSNKVNITNNASTDTSPIWSPDGTRILFSSFRTGNAEVFVMNANGTGQTNLTNNSKEDGSASWQPRN